jgi:hypothetical protein
MKKNTCLGPNDGSPSRWDVGDIVVHGCRDAAMLVASDEFNFASQCDTKFGFLL